MTWPRRPEPEHVAHGGAHLLVVLAVLLALGPPAFAQAPDPAPPASDPAPDPAPQAAPAPAPKTVAPAPAPAPAQAAQPAAAPVTEPAAAPAARPAAKPRPQRRERAKRRQPAKRKTNARPTSVTRTFGTPAISAPRLVAEPGTLASTDARLAALALLVAAAGSLGLIGHLHREMAG